MADRCEMCAQVSFDDIDDNFIEHEVREQRIKQWLSEHTELAHLPEEERRRRAIERNGSWIEQLATGAKQYARKARMLCGCRLPEVMDRLDSYERMFMLFKDAREFCRVLDVCMNTGAAPAEYTIPLRTLLDGCGNECGTRHSKSIRPACASAIAHALLGNWRQADFCMGEPSRAYMSSCERFVYVCMYVARNDIRRARAIAAAPFDREFVAYTNHVRQWVMDRCDDL